jgi:predicted Zn-ribbon and HTH transcriptional regulator
MPNRNAVLITLWNYGIRERLDEATDAVLAVGGQEHTHIEHLKEALRPFVEEDEEPPISGMKECSYCGSFTHRSEPIKHLPSCPIAKARAVLEKLMKEGE